MMKTILIMLLFLPFASLAQTLTVEELRQVHKQAGKDAGALLDTKGYTVRPVKLPEGAFQWIFPRGGNPEIISGFISKMRTDAGRSRTSLQLFSPYHYKVFTDNLLAEHYAFTGVEFVSGTSYNVFSKKGATIRTAVVTEYGETRFNVVIED